MPAQVLKTIPLFKGLAEREIGKISKRATVTRVPKDYVILKESQKVASGDFYVIKKGRVKVSRIGSNDREIIFTFLKKGDFFGEMAIIERQPRSASVTAISNVELIAIKGKDFLQLLHQYPSIGLNLLKVMSQRIRRSDMQLKGLTTTSTIDRVATALIQEAEVYGVRKKTGIVVDPGIPVKELATIAGTTSGIAVRALNTLAKAGFVRRSGKKMVIKDYGNFKNLFG